MIVTLDIEVTDSKESIDDIDFFTFLRENNERFFRGNKARKDIDNGSDIGKPDNTSNNSFLANIVPGVKNFDFTS